MQSMACVRDLFGMKISRERMYISDNRKHVACRTCGCERLKDIERGEAGV